MGLLRIRSQAQKAAGVRTRHGSDQTGHSLNPKLMEVGWFQTVSLPQGRCSCVAPSCFSFCSHGHCRRRAQQVPPRFLFMARSTRSTTECAPSRPPHPNMELSSAAGGAATSLKAASVGGFPMPRPPALCARAATAQHPATSPDDRSAESWGMPALTRPQKITFGEMRDSGVRGVLIY